MARVKRGFKARRRRKRLLELAKGFYGRSKNTIRQGHSAVDNALQYAYIGRKQRKRDFRALWNQRIGAAVKAQGLSYSRFIHALKIKNIELDRKILADLAVYYPNDFSKVVELAKS